jgi:hypothetical protein
MQNSLKKLISAFLVTAFFPSLAFARLGETQAQSIQRYGQPTKTAGNLSFYAWNGFEVIEAYNDGGKAIVSAFVKRNGPITKEEATDLDNENAPRRSSQEHWETASGNLKMPFVNLYSLSDRAASDAVFLMAGPFPVSGQSLDTRVYSTPEGDTFFSSLVI